MCNFNDNCRYGSTCKFAHSNHDKSTFGCLGCKRENTFGCKQRGHLNTNCPNKVAVPPIAFAK